MTTGAGEPLFVDTNILVYGAVPEGPFYATARQALETHVALGSALWVSRQILREFLAVLTRPQEFTPPIPIEVLAPAVRRFESLMQVADETAEVTARLLTLLEVVPCGGKQIHDANIVATMQVIGVRRLLTANPSDFHRFGSLITLGPL